MRVCPRDARVVVPRGLHMAATELVQFGERDMSLLSANATELVRRVWPMVACVAALCLLNAMLTFHNVWPTLSVRPSKELSLDLAGILLLLVGLRWIRGPVP